jgi:hypothetical protein
MANLLTHFFSFFHLNREMDYEGSNWNPQSNSPLAVSWAGGKECDAGRGSISVNYLAGVFLDSQFLHPQREKNGIHSINSNQLSGLVS